MKRNIIAALLLPVATLALAACGSSQSSSTEPTDGLGAFEDEQTLVLTKYDGSYQTFCGVSVFAPLSNTSVTVTSIDGDKGSITTYNYVDRGCTMQASPTQTVMEISLAYPGGTVETSQGEADFVDVTIESIKLDGLPPTFVQQQQLSQSSILGTRYDILVLQDSALYSGASTEELHGNTSDARPNTLSTQPAIAQ